MIQRSSLSQTADAVNELLFAQHSIAAHDAKQVAHWIAARQGRPGAYANTFAGFPSELEKGILLFTGERVTSASARHILGEEAARVLRSLKVHDKEIDGALERANAGLINRLNQAALDPRHSNPGRYCCGKCTVGLWRNLLAGGLNRQEERLHRGVGEELRAHRSGDGKWRKFPFWYTVLALSEMDFAEARDELAYAAPELEKTVKRVASPGVHGRRRYELARRVLAKV